MRTHTITATTKLALLLALLALGALGLVVFEGDDDDLTTAVSEAETAGEGYVNLRPYYRRGPKTLARKQEAEARFVPAELSRKQVQELKRGRGKQVRELKRVANHWAALFAVHSCNRYRASQSANGSSATTLW
jgi:hypothetical protein